MLELFVRNKVSSRPDKAKPRFTIERSRYTTFKVVSGGTKWNAQVNGAGQGRNEAEPVAIDCRSSQKPCELWNRDWWMRSSRRHATTVRDLV